MIILRPKQRRTERSIDEPTGCRCRFCQTVRLLFYLSEWEIHRRDNMNLHGLFGYLWVYLSDKKCAHPFRIKFTKIRLPFKNILSKTSIEGEAQEQLRAWISMCYSSYFCVFLLH